MSELSAEANEGLAELARQGREAREAREAVAVTEALSGMSDKQKEFVTEAAAYGKQSVADYLANGGKPPKNLA